MRFGPCVLLFLGFVVLAVAPAGAVANPATNEPATRETIAELEDISRVPGSLRRVLFRFQAAEQEDDRAGAIAILAEYLQSHAERDHFLLRFHLGRLLLHDDQLDGAAEHLRQAVTLEPRYGPAWQLLGWAAFSLESYPEAADAFTTSWQRSADPSPDLLYYAANAWLEAEQPGSALLLLNRLISGELAPPRLDWYRAAVTAALADERFAEVSTLARSLTERFPDDAVAWTLASQAAGACGECRQAAIYLRAASYLRPLSPAELKQLGGYYNTAGVPELAAEVYEQAFSESATIQELELLASTLLAAHRRDTARTVLQRALADEPTARLWSLLGDMLYLDGEPSASLDAFTQCFELDPTQGRAVLMMGICANELDRTREAVSHLRRAVGFPELAEQARRLLHYLEDGDKPSNEVGH